MSSHRDRPNKQISLPKASFAKKPSSDSHRSLSTSSSSSLSNSLDWDSPSHKTGTVKRRPLSSSDCASADVNEPNQSRVVELQKRFNQTFIPKRNGHTTDDAKGDGIITRHRYHNNTELAKPSLQSVTHKNRVALTPTPYGEATKASVSGSLDASDKTSDEDTCYAGKTGSSRCISDTDSGIASPLSPSSLGSGGGFGDADTSSFGYIQGLNSVLECQRDECGCRREQTQIYTDWANHYLEKGRSKKRVNSLAADCSDGVLLADVIESVTCQKIPDVNRKPKTPAQMLDNINLCLSALKAQHVAGVDAVSGQDLRDGRLKAILALFFALSRHKQAVKQRNQAAAAAAQLHAAEMTPNRSSSLSKSTNPTSSIPLPGSALPSRRCPPGGGDKIRPVINNTTTATGAGATSSPSRAPSPAVSMIPQRGAGGAASGPVNVNTSPYHQQMIQQGNKGSMLDKLRLFKGGADVTNRQQTSCGKRTSSSSGVSSARSERSDSSVSLDVISPADNNGKVRSTSRLKPHKMISTSTSTGNVKSIATANGGVNQQLKSSPNATKKHTTTTTHYQSAAASNNKAQPKLSSKQQQQQQVFRQQHQIICTSASSTALSSSNITVNAVSAAGTGIPKPTAAIKGTKVEKGANKGQQQGLSRENSQLMGITPQKPTIGVVSPMKSDSHPQLSDSCHSICTLPQSNSSESSVIYKASGDIGSDQHINKGQIRSSGQHISNHEKDLLIENKLMSNGHTHKDKSQTTTTISSSASLTPLPTSSITVLPSSQSTMSIMNNSSHIPPMRPLFRPHHYTAANSNGCSNTLTLPTPRPRPITPGNHVYNHRVQPDGGSDYCDVMLGGGGGSGYMSDGEMLRYPGSVGRAQQMQMLQYGAALQSNGAQMGGYYAGGMGVGGMDNTGMYSDGYMSEGGIGLYTRRQQEQQQQSDRQQGQMMGVNGSDQRVNPTISHHQSLSTSTISSVGSSGVLTDQQQSTRSSRGRPAHDDPANTAQQQQPLPPGPRKNTPTFPLPTSDKHMTNTTTTSSQWKRYTDSPGVGSPPINNNNGQPPPPPAPGSPTDGGSRERKGGKGAKVRGVPQSFGYVKRGGTGSSSNGIPSQSGKTAQVSAVPRTKVKVSGGTQTCSSDLQPHKGVQQQQQFKSFSLTGNAANQLSQSVRERLMLGSQSLPKGACQITEYGGLVIRQQQARGGAKTSDGSLSDTQAIDISSPYAPWLRHSNTYSVAPRLSETDSMESLTSLPGHRGSLTHNRLLRDSPNRLSRSNSIRSTKSEKLYPSMLQRSAEQEQEPYYCLPVGAILNHWSQPTSPAPGTNRNFPLSPTHSIPRHNLPKNDDIHGSSVSLVSTASSLYSSPEEKQAHEIRKLRRELMDAQEKVQTLTSQLNTNAHVVSAFEQSLASMNQRLQHLTATSEKKDTELSELRAALEALRTQSIQAGISNGLARQPSSDSVSSLSSACSLDKHEKKKKKGWLRSSFTKAFSRNAKVTKVPSQSESEMDREQSQRQSNPPSPPPPPPIDSGPEVQELQKQLREKDLVLTDIRLEALSSAHQLESLKDTVMKMRSEMLSLKQNNERLQRMVSGSVNGGQQEATHLSGGNLQHYHNNNSNSMDPLTDLMQSTDDGAADSLPLPDGEMADGKRISISVYLGQPHTFQQYYATHYRDVDDEQHQDLESVGQLKNGGTLSEGGLNEISIAYTSVSATTTWPQLDNAVRRAFKTHVARLDPGGGLGLGSDSVSSYTLGDSHRSCNSSPPDLLPYGYVVGHVRALQLVLHPVAALAFETLIPKGVAQRLVSLLSEHRRIVLCGAPGTGKTHLAERLARFHAQSVDREDEEAVITFNVDNKTAKELRQYLAHLSEQSAAGETASIPCVVILDNLHKAGPLADALGSLPRNLPCLLGTMAQSACSATSLQLQHGFRWVLVAPHMEPARGLLGRVLRRRLATLELDNGPQPELAAVLGWLPRVWQHLNAFLETHSSGDVVIGPRLFLSCPLELDAARAWFADIWNYSLTPYLRDAAREGLQLYGRRAAWTDPCQFIVDTYPWSGAPPQGLTNITAKDVGLDSDPSSQAESDGDPLLNMLMRLQEAANYSSPHSNDSDCNSLDSNVTNNSNSTVGTESVS